jgi:hypothetical protein
MGYPTSKTFDGESMALLMVEDRPVQPIIIDWEKEALQKSYRAVRTYQGPEGHGVAFYVAGGRHY